jgi:hypothetical protein
VRSGTHSEDEAWLDKMLPIIRVRKRLSWSIFPPSREVVALYRDELIAARIPRSVLLPEAVYEPAGAAELRALGTSHGRVAVVPLDKVITLSSLRRSRLRETDGLRVTIGRRQAIRFRVRSHEVPNLYRALNLLLGSRFRHRNWPSLSGIFARLAPFPILLAVALLVLVSSRRSSDLRSYIGGTICFLSLLAPILGALAIIPGPTSIRNAGRIKTNPTKDLSGREPLRLRFAGIIIGAAGTLALLYAYGFTAHYQLTPLIGKLEWSQQLWYLMIAALVLYIMPCFSFSSASRLAIALALLGLLVGIVLLVISMVMNPSFRQFYALLFLMSPYLGLLLIHAGRSLVSRNARIVMVGDQRAPILYLRSFEDDVEDTLTPHTFLATLFGITMPSEVRRLPLWQRVVFEAHPLRLLRSLFGRITRTTELQLAGFFRELGPFIAIGKPGERLATIGADRVYVEQDKWQQVVIDLINKSRFVVLQAAATPGFLWELRTVLEKAPATNILFCLSNFRDRQNDYEDFRLNVESEIDWRFPRSVGNHSEPQFLFFDEGRKPIVQTLSYLSPLFWPALGEVTNLRHTLMGFLDRAHGGELLCPPKTYRGHSVLAFLLFLTVIPAIWAALLYTAVLVDGILRR